MKLRGHGNGLSIAIAALAVVIAGSGTAVAVSSTTTISDPTVPSRIAHVNTLGQLLTDSTPDASTIATNGNFLNSGTVFMTTASTASIAITQVLLSETRLNGTTNGSDLNVQLVQVPADQNGVCGAAPTRYLALISMSSGDHVDLASTVPFVVKPTGTTPYCIGLKSAVTNGATDVTPNYPRFTFTGYTVKGTYTGLGANGVTAAVGPQQKTR